MRISDWSSDVCSSDLKPGSILELLVAQGVIPPTALQFGLIELEDEITILDEAEGEIELTFRTDVEGGEGGTTSFEGGFEDWQPAQAGCDPAAFPLPVLIGFTPADTQDIVPFTLSAIPEDAGPSVRGGPFPTPGGRP